MSSGPAKNASPFQSEWRKQKVKTFVTVVMLFGRPRKTAITATTQDSQGTWHDFSFSDCWINYQINKGNIYPATHITKYNKVLQKSNKESREKTRAKLCFCVATEWRPQDGVRSHFSRQEQDTYNLIIWRDGLHRFGSLETSAVWWWWISGITTQFDTSRDGCSFDITWRKMRFSVRSQGSEFVARNGRPVTDSLSQRSWCGWFVNRRPGW